MKRLLVARESLLATILTIIITYGVSFIPFKFEFSKAIRQEFLGFDIYDLYYSGKHLKNTQRDNDIVLVEIGDDRVSIAGQLGIIQKYSPAVIGIDAVFEQPGDTTGDSILTEAINRHDNIVFASRYDIDSATKKPVFIHNFFEKDRHYPTGYINFLGNQFSVIRNYPPSFKTNGTPDLAFTSAIMQKFSPGKFDTFMLRNKKTEIINYKGNLETYTSISKEQFTEYDAGNQLDSMFKGKIVLLGYFDKYTPLVMDDIHFSPLNEQVAGKKLS
ncbi:MAG: CHASE2 domain-containing protein [Bacteroidota bacterium]